MRRLLMISPHFPPDSSAGTHRVRLLAPHLPAHGWEPVVLTVDPGAYEGRLDPALAALVPPSLRVVRSRALPAALTRLAGIGDLGLRALPGLRRDALRLGREQAFDAVFITIYPSYTALLGPVLKRRLGLPFVLDYQDPWVGAWGRDVGGGPGGRVDLRSRLSRGLAGRLEPRVLAAADGVTAVSARTYLEALARAHATPAAVAEIPIGWDPADLEAARTHTGAYRLPDDGRAHLCYVGTLLPLGVETLRVLLTGVRRALEVSPALAGRLRLHFVGTSNQTRGGVERVMPHARELGVAHVVDEHPDRLDYLDALALLRRATGLLLLGSTERHYTPSKVFPALTAGRPVLALYHAESTACDLIRRALPPPAGQLVTYDEAHPAGARCDEIAEALSRLAAAGPEPVRAEPAALEPWSAPALAGRLAGVCDRVVA